MGLLEFFSLAFVRPYLISELYDFGRCSAVKLIYVNEKPWFFYCLTLQVIRVRLSVMF